MHISVPENSGICTPIEFDLSAGKRANKTIDIGNNGTTLSTTIFGRILQISTYHPEHGIIVAAAYEQFDGSKYHDPSYVRKYRQRMLQMVNCIDQGFGINLRHACNKVEVDIAAMNVATVRCRTDTDAEVCYTLSVGDSGTLFQTVQISNTTDKLLEVECRANLQLSVHRASYGQLTEGGPIPLPQCENQLSSDYGDGSFTIYNKHLGAHLAGTFDINGTPQSLDGLANATSHGVLHGSCSQWKTLRVLPDSTVEIRLALSLAAGLPPSSIGPYCISKRAQNAMLWKNPASVQTFLVRRNVDYILGNCAIPVSDEAVAIITDHVALPLGWNRDNYWQWRLLLMTRPKLSSLVVPKACSRYEQLLDQTLEGHLRWVFFTAERPHTYWHRSYLVTGKPKDGPVYQLDQQCYPILELCDYLTEFPERVASIDVETAAGVIAEVLDYILASRDASSGLFPTDETPGDDEVIYPFHFSTHVLLWYALRRLADVFNTLNAQSPYTSEVLQLLADDIHRATMHHFVIGGEDRSDKSKIAYLVDGLGKHTFYHDGNDIPTVFATKWGFISTRSDFNAWKNTMDFALSEENTQGYASGGPFAGLGSVHSTGPWPLGYFQEMLYYALTEQHSAEQLAFKKIINAMQWDGTFGEALDAVSGATTSKAWFSWPGSMIATAILETFL